MGTMVLYNIDLMVGIFLLVWIMRKNRQSQMGKAGKLLVQAVAVLGIAVLAAVLVFVDFIAMGIIGLVPN